MPAVRIVVRGRVQGVGFRFHVQQAALLLGVFGEVWNRTDKSVEVLAEHPDTEILSEFAKAIEAGPGFIQDLQSWPTSDNGYTRFEVTATR